MPTHRSSQLPSQHTSGERRRLTLSFLLSLLIHALLLNLTFGGQEYGFPGLAFPWQERRIEAPELRVVLRPARVMAPEPAGTSIQQRLRQGSVEQTAGSLAPTPSASLVPPPTPIREVAVIAMERADEATFVVPPPPPAPRDAGEAAPKPAEPEVQERTGGATQPDPSNDEAQRQADRLEAARLEAARLEAERREVERLAADQLEVERQEAVRQEAARVEAERLEATRQEAERLAAARLEAQRREAARREAARVEAERLEAERQEATRQAEARMEAQRREVARQEAARAEATRLEAERREAARLAAAQQEAARVLAEQQEDARREARRRAMGRQLEEERARREAAANAARSPSTLPLSLSTARRVRLWGRSDPNAELVQYAEAWAQKIQFNTPVETVREVAKRPHTNPMVTVAIRSDGSVESVTFVLSSGVAEVDEAIRRIVQSHAPYPAFPPALARDYDVVEVRRTWHFDTAVRLY